MSRLQGIGTPFVLRTQWVVKRNKKLVPLGPATAEERDHYKRHRSGAGLKPRPEITKALAALVANDGQPTKVVESSSGITVSEAIVQIMATTKKGDKMYKVLYENMERALVGRDPLGRPCEPVLGTVRVRDLTPITIIAWISGNEGWTSPTYRSQAVKAARHVVKWCRLAGKLDRDEIANLTRANLEDQDGQLSFNIAGKNLSKKGTGERIPVFDPKAEALFRKQMAKAGEDGLLFPNEHNRPYNEQSWNDPLRTIAEHTKIRKDMTIYWLRHSFINRMLDAGVPKKFVADLAGNSERTIDEYYRSKGKIADHVLRRVALEAVAVG
jgi:hypothetical protein